MIGLLNKSVKSIYNNFTNNETRPNVKLIKIHELALDENISKLCVILVVKSTINVFIMLTEPQIEFKLIFVHEFNNTISLLEPSNDLSKFSNSNFLPLLSIATNTPLFNENKIRFLSLKKKEVVFTLSTKFNIVQMCFSKYFFAVGCINGKIYVYENEKMDMILKINSSGKVKLIDGFTKNVLADKKVSESLDISKVSSQLGQSLKTEDNENQTMKTMIIKQKPKKKERKFYNVAFTLTNDHIIFSFSQREISSTDDLEDDLENDFVNVENTQVQQTNLSSFESFALEAYKNFSKFKDWSLQSLNEYSNLRKSKLTKMNNTSATTDSTSTAYIVALVSKPPLQSYSISTIRVPFFTSISSITQKQNGKYLIFSNKNLQMFYIYELYPQSNSKYGTKEIKYKIIYSMLRGITSCTGCSVDISSQKKFSIITSNKGTSHIFHLPKRDNQISEDVVNRNSGDEYLNMKIVNGVEVWKKNNSSYNSNNSKYCSKFITIEKVNINEFDDKAKLNELIHDNFSNYISNGNFVIMACDNVINIALILDEKNIILLKNSIKLNTEDDFGIVLQNYNEVMKELNRHNKKGKQNCNIFSNQNPQFDTETTNFSNFSVYQLNPMFEFCMTNSRYRRLSIETKKYVGLVNEHVMEIFATKEKAEIKDLRYNSQFKSKEMILYETLILNPKPYSRIKKSYDKRRRSDVLSETMNSKRLIINPNYSEVTDSLEIKNNFYDDKDNILEDNIKEALNTNISDVINPKNTVLKKSEVKIKDNFYYN